MYRIRWFMEDTASIAMGAIGFIHSIIVGVIDVAASELFGPIAQPTHWDRLKVVGLAIFTLTFAGATAVVYNLAVSPEARVLGTAWFVLCTMTASLVYIFYFRLKAEQDALMG